MASASEVVLDRDLCAQEPIHIIGQTQSYGLLFALSEPDLIVRQLSNNVGAFIGLDESAILGCSIERVFGPSQLELFQTRLRSNDLSAASPFVVELGNPARQMNCVVHRHDEMLILELESREGAVSTDTLTLLSIAVNTPALLSEYRQSYDFERLCAVTADTIRALSGFDRVLIYRFDAEWDGCVVAASVAAGTQTYLGNYFPASDIPAQARHLFLTNVMRAIADIDEPSAAIVPEINPQTGRPLDLSRSFLRTPSAMHLEFLRNWGVRASLTVSVIVDDQLWGMVACHHPTPLRLDCATRSICELIGRNLGLQVGVKKAVEKQQQQELARHLLDELHEDLLTSATCIDARSVARPRLLEILDADGVVIQFGGHSSSLGKTISAEQLRPIIGKLRAQAVRGIASSKILSGLDASAETYAKVASGALYVGLAASSGDYLLFLRGEREEIIRWAGNPDKSVSMDLEGKLHPRTSFAEWYQSLRGRSRPWSDIQLETARDLREQLIDVRDLHISALAVEIEDGAAKVRE